MELHKLKDVSRFFNKTLMFLSLLFISSNLAINFSPQPRFSFFAQHSNQNFIANMEYRYEENDINHLLRLRAQEEQISLHGNILIPAMGDITHQLEDKLRIEQLHHANLPPEKEVRQHSRKILIPLNLTKAHHWVGIVIQFNDSNQVEVINYIDSLSHTKIPTKLKRRLQHIYGKDTKIINKRGMLQTDNTGCGPLVIENLMQSTQNSLSKEVVTKEKMQTIRNKHLRLAKKYLPLKPRTPTTMYGGGSGGDTSDEDEDKYKSTDSNDESSNSTTGNNSEEYSSSAEDEWVNPLQFFISNPHKDWQLLYDANGVYRHLTNPDRQETPLHHLVLEEDASSIATYPNIQAEINQRDFLEETPLHNAAYKGNAEIMTLLLENGGNPNILNEEELSPLHIALIQQNLTMIKVLFEHEANFLSSHSGYSITELLDNPFQQLRSSNELEEFILKLIELLNYGYGCRVIGKEWKQKTQLRAQIEEYFLPFVKHRAKLSENGPGFDYWDEETMLEYIIEREDWEMFNDHAMDLVDNIFGDSDSLRTVLKFLDKHEVKLEHLETWLSQGHLAIAQFTKLMKYAKIHSDQEMQILLEEYGEILTSTNSYENNYTMKILLNHYLKNNLGKGLVKIIDLTCIDKPKLQKILTRLLKSKPPIMVLPINVGSMHSPKGTSNIHWTTFFIYPLRGQPPLIIYLDPFGKEIPLLLSDVLKNLYPNAKVVNPRIKILDHVSDCGLWLIITLDSLVNQRDPLISMENARQNHLELMANHVANNLSAEETTHSSKFLRNKTLPNLARILTFPISKHKSKGRVSRILRETHSFRPYRSFAAERERQILRQVATQLYLSLKNNFPKLGEVQAMHLSHDENNYLFIAVNQRNVTNELAKFIKDKNTFRELLTKTYKPSRDPEGKIRSRRYATKLAKRIFGTDIQLPTSKNTSDGEQAHMVAKLLRGGTWSTLPLKSANDVLHLENNKIYLVLPPTHGTNNKHAEEFLCDIAEYIYKDIKKKPHTCIGGKKRPCMGCFSRMHCENIDSFGQHPGYFWLETMDNQPSEIALNTLQSLCCYPPSVSSCKYGRNTTSYDSGSDSDDEGEDNRANKMKLTTTTIPPAKQPQQLISPPSGTTSPPNNSLEKFKTTYGFNAVEAGGEGNCFFHAILAQLKLLKKSRKIADKILGKKVEDYTHQDLRRLAVQHIVDHRDWYANYMMNNETVDDFVSRMQVDGEFVEGAIVRAMAQVLDMHLVIVSNNSSTIVFRRLNTNAPILFLAHYTDLHYQSLEPNSSADIIPFDITQFDITDNLPPSTVEEYHGDNNTLTTITETLSTLSLTTENRPLIDIASFF